MVTWCRDQGFGSRQGRSLGGAEAGREMGLTSRSGLLNLGSRPHFEVATWLVQFGVATWTLFRSLFVCCSWTLFTSTVHRVKKKYKIFKNFLVHDLIYGIFTLQLL